MGSVALLVDDLLFRPMISMLDVFHAMAVEEVYDEGEIRDDLRENQLLYELGERPEEEYRDRKQELEARLERAQAAKSELGDRVEIKR